MENSVKEDLYKYLRSVGELDERMPECPDVADAWRKIAEAYLPDGIREFSGYPTVSLGWMMFLGMAMAQFWDENWTEYGQNTNIYEMLRDKRGYDNMDEYILEEVLRLDAEKRRQTSQLRRRVCVADSRYIEKLRHRSWYGGRFQGLCGVFASNVSVWCCCSA